MQHLIDSHCHLNRVHLDNFDGSFDKMLEQAYAQGVSHLLSVCVGLDEYPALCKIADQYPNIFISVGIHPDIETDIQFKPGEISSQLVELATSHSACIAIGETGLDYYRVATTETQSIQRSLFREHIHASIATSKPLIIHTRQAAEDTLHIMQEENTSRVGGVMHCFTEDLSIALRAIDLGFYISLSGIVTFKNATAVHEVAKKVPLERLLIETDAPYLAPMPFRGKQNHPALVKYTAACISELRQISIEELAIATSQNFARCFNVDVKLG